MSNIKLTPAQQNQTLAAKVQKEKNKKMKPLAKNVLVQPIQSYWPQIHANKVEKLMFLMSNTNISEEHTSNKWIKFGLSATLRALNQNADIEILLLAANIKPRFIVEQIIFQAINRGIKILLIPNMSEYFKRIMKFSCLSLIFLKTYIDRSPYKDLIEWITELTKGYPFTNSMLKLLAQINPVKRDVEQSAVDMETDESDKTKRFKNEMKIDFNKLYIQKIDSSKRSFVPNSFEDTQKIDKSRIKPIKSMDNWSDYISFSNEDPNVKDEADEEIKKNTETNGKKFETISIVKKQKIKKKKLKVSADNVKNCENLFNYITLKVNKIQGNPNKKKEK